MKLARIYLLLVSTIPFVAAAGVSPGDLPGGAIWYLHANFAQMRSSESGSPIYKWFYDEVIVEINEELGIQLNDEVDSVTAFSAENMGTVIVVQGRLSENLRDELLKTVRRETLVTDRSVDGKSYYFVRDEENSLERGDDPFDDFEDAVYFSFDVKGKLIVTSHEDQIKELLKSGGKIAGAGSVDRAMFVLTADRSFVQAGLRPDGMADDGDDDWESNIIRNTEQAAMLISDSNGQIAVEARLISTDPKMAQSIGGIVNGLISLQAFNPDLDPDLLSLIQNTRVTSNENMLSISTVIDPNMVVKMIAD
jgi:hypothetical protein